MITKFSSGIAAFTVCARNYFAQAFLLQESFRLRNPECDFYIILMDRRDDVFTSRFPSINIIWVEDIGLPHFHANALRFDVIEFSTNVKPHCLSLFLNIYQKVLYLDPDTFVFDTLAPVYDELDHHSIVMTPASMTPVLDGHRPDDIEFLRVGVFNLGFIGVSACDEARRFLQWWSDRCLSDGFHETQSGVFVDQKWINLVPCYFERSKIIKDPGVNMAPWNLHERTLSLVDGRYIVNESAVLRLFHFSSFDPHRPQIIAKRQTRFADGERADLRSLLNDYAAALLAAGFDELSKHEYSFDYFPSGEYISPTLRRLYANPAYKFPMDEDPAQPSSALMQFARENRLIGKQVTKSKRQTASDISAYSRQVRLLGLVFKVGLKILGPNRYFLLMRYLAHASSIRNQPPL